jgi:hypothetical protein
MTDQNTAPEATTPAPRTFSGQDLADLIGVQGIQLRRYIRSDGTRVGRGRTYKFTTEEAAAILEGFVASKTKDADAEKIKAEVAELLTPAEESTDTE